MSVPPEVTIKDASGKYNLNKTISDDTIPLLQMQQVSWLVQQVARYGSVQIVLKQHSDDEGVVHIDQESTSTGYITTSEQRALDGEWREKTDSIWGHIRSQTKFVKLADVEDEWLKEGWEDEMGGDAVETYAESLTPNNWTARQVWGFAEVEGERRHVRRVLAKKEDSELRIRLIYDWVSPPPADEPELDDDEMNPGV